MAKKSAAGLLVLVDSINLGRVALLSKRGSVTCDRNEESLLWIVKPQGFPGCCQTTVFGGLSKKEMLLPSPDKFHAAITRETEEELGFGAKSWLLSYGYIGYLRELNMVKDEGAEIAIYGIVVNETFLHILPQGVINSLVFLKREDVPNIVVADGSFKHDGVTDRKVIAMASDTKDAVTKAFEIF